MRPPETVLGMLHDRGKRGLPIDDLYRQLFNPELYLRAYARLYSHPGAMTKGTTSETVDAMSMQKIHRIIDLIRHERYRWTPARRTYLLKKNGKKRPLGMPTWSDKLLQEVLRSLLEAYYEPQFSEASHGFRPGRGCHTALSHIQHAWTGSHWFIEGDIKACFDQLDHTVLLHILAQKIQDNRFLRLLTHLLQAGYLEEWRFHTTLSGTPQGGVISPLLANIYLDQLDQHIQTHLLPRYTQGTMRKNNPTYAHYNRQAFSARHKGEYHQARAFNRLARQHPRGDPHDPNYRRLRYVRYADDILLGFAGPKSEAEEIKSHLATFLHETLKLELSQEKTLITHAKTQPARFLGYEIVARWSQDRLISTGKRKGHRTLSGSIGLRVPADVVEKKCALYRDGGKPAGRPSLASRDDYTIITTYQAEYRGLVQYYQLAENLHWLTRLHWAMQQSLVRTLSRKYRQSPRAILRRYKAWVETPVGKRRCLQMSFPRDDGKPPRIARFGGLPLQRNQQAVLVDRVPTPFQYSHKELLQRLRRGRCELCQRQGECEVHHLRKLAELERYGKGGKMPYWAYLMKKKRRKTLIVCLSCHRAIHEQHVEQNLKK